MTLVTDETLHRNDIPRIATGKDKLVIIQTDRRDTAKESIDAFVRTVDIVMSSGNMIQGHETPIDGALVMMKEVGVVLRDKNGKRVWCDCSDPNCRSSNATLWFAANTPDKMYATLNDHVAVAPITRL
jgi:hypothetical protein